MNSSSAGWPSWVCLDAAVDRVLDLAGLGDALAVAAERLGEIGVIAADVGRAVLLGRDRHDLQLDRHREIVRQDRQDRQALAHRGLEIHAGEADRRVAPEIDAELVGAGQLGAHREAETVAELGRLAPADIGERRLADPERRDLVARAAGVVGDDRVLDVDRVQQVPDHPVGRDRRRVRGQPVHPLAEPLLAVAARSRASPRRAGRAACPSAGPSPLRAARRASARHRRPPPDRPARPC